jgi:hypothetical protein
MGGVVPAPPGGAGGGGVALGAGLLELRLNCGARLVVKRVPGAPPACPETQQTVVPVSLPSARDLGVARGPGALHSCSAAWGRMLQLCAQCARLERVDKDKHVCES